MRSHSGPKIRTAEQVREGRSAEISRQIPAKEISGRGDRSVLELLTEIAAASENLISLRNELTTSRGRGKNISEVDLAADRLDAIALPYRSLLEQFLWNLFEELNYDQNVLEKKASFQYLLDRAHAEIEACSDLRVVFEAHALMQDYVFLPVKSRDPVASEIANANPMRWAERKQHPHNKSSAPWLKKPHLFIKHVYAAWYDKGVLATRHILNDKSLYSTYTSHVRAYPEDDLNLIKGGQRHLYQKIAKGHRLKAPSSRDSDATAETDMRSYESARRRRQRLPKPQQ